MVDAWCIYKSIKTSTYFKPFKDNFPYTTVQKTNLPRQRSKEKEHTTTIPSRPWYVRNNTPPKKKSLSLLLLYFSDCLTLIYEHVLGSICRSPLDFFAWLTVSKEWYGRFLSNGACNLRSEKYVRESLIGFFSFVALTVFLLDWRGYCFYFLSRTFSSFTLMLHLLKNDNILLSEMTHTLI